MAIGPRFPIEDGVPMHRVPWEWTAVVCTCSEDHGTKSVPEHLLMACIKCSKLKRFYTSYCHDCKQFYLIAFKHPHWTPRVNVCWNCLAPSNGAVAPLDKFLFPTPKKSSEELAKDLDSLLSFEF